MVATRVVGIQEIIADEETGLLVPPNNLSVLASALMRFRQDAALREKLVEGGQQYANAHGSLETVVERS